ncbi:MAG: molybdopterin-binding protein [Rubripirellula sp.]
MTKPPCRQLTCEIVSIGDEMTSGSRLDTNAQWLSRRIGELGVVVKFHSTVGDTLSDNVDVFRIAASRADIVVATGGLGPTRDDLTREALSIMVDRPLEMRDSAMKHIESMFIKRQRHMPERNRVQAMFPIGSDEIFNPQGTAPGIDLKVDRDGQTPSRIFALPGVPAEMFRMFDETVAPRIMQQSGGGSRISHAVMKFFGVGESEMEQRLGEMISRDREPRVGITVSGATISLRITATADTDETCAAMIAMTREEILQLVPEYYFGDGESFEQQHAVEATLRARNESLCVIELGRAAVLGDWFASLGDSPAYRGGISLSTTDDMVGMLDVADTAAAMAEIQRRFRSDWVLMVDAYPPLDVKSDFHLPSADVNLVVRAPGGKCHEKMITIGGHPDILHARIGKAAMAWLREVLQ